MRKGVKKKKERERGKSQRDNSIVKRERRKGDS